MGDLGFFGIGEKDYSETLSVRSCFSNGQMFATANGAAGMQATHLRRGYVVAGIDGLSREVERSGSELVNPSVGGEEDGA